MEGPVVAQEGEEEEEAARDLVREVPTKKKMNKDTQRY